MSHIVTNAAPVKRQVMLAVNGQRYDVYVDTRKTLLDTLRDDLRLTGAKKVCDMGNCGACTVLVNGRAQYACLMLAIECEGLEIRTVEGLQSEQGLHPVQQAFIQEDAFQCGFCTPGQIMSVVSLLDSNPDPTDDEILRAVSGNLCRCGTYPKILRAARTAASMLRDK